MPRLKRIEELLHVFWRFASKQLFAVVGILEYADNGAEHVEVRGIHGIRYEHEADYLDF